MFKNTKIDEKKDFKELWQSKIFWQFGFIVVVWAIVFEIKWEPLIFLSVYNTINLIISIIRYFKYIKN